MSKQSYSGSTAERDPQIKGGGKDKNDGAIRLRLASSSYRAAAKSGKPEAVAKVASHARGFRVSKVVNYVARTGQEEELALEDENGVRIEGPQEIEKKLAEWSQDFERAKPNSKRPPRHATHLILSAAAENSPADARRVLDAARETLREQFGKQGYEYLAVLHTDTGRPHVHVVIKNKPRAQTSTKQDKEAARPRKLRLNPPELFELRARFAARLEQRGIEQVATLRRDRAAELAKVANGIERIQKENSHFHAQMREASVHGDDFARRRRQAETIKRMRATVQKETRAGTEERKRLMGAVRDLNRELKKKRPNMPEVMAAAAKKLGRDVERITGYYRELREHDKNKTMKLGARRQRSETIKKLAAQVERDLQAARQKIQITVTTPEAKAAALKAIKHQERTLKRALITRGHHLADPSIPRQGASRGKNISLRNDQFDRRRDAGIEAPERLGDLRNVSRLTLVHQIRRTPLLLPDDARSRMGEHGPGRDNGVRRPGAGRPGRGRVERGSDKDRGR